ncbi:MAG: GNAT family N-acetyltransferase [Ornithinimicrobium sp.]
MSDTLRIRRNVQSHRGEISFLGGSAYERSKRLGATARRGSLVIWSVHPVTSVRFDDFLDVVNPNRRANHCFCVPHRLRTADVRELGDGDREQAMRALCRRDDPPGIVAYHDDRPVGWCNVGARADMPTLVHSQLIRPIDDVPVWSIVCLVVRGGHRKQGVTRHLIDGAVEYAASRNAPAVEAYPVDPGGRMDTTMAFVGTRSMFERAGFEVVGQTDAMASRMPRLIMRREL